MRAQAGYKCERCGDHEDPESGHTLTVNLVDKLVTDPPRANLVVLCRHCQGRLRVIPLDHLANQLEMFEPFELRWLQPHLEGMGIRVPEPRLRRN
jgi:hypothetical protein